MTPADIAKVREALKQRCGGGTEFHSDGNISVAFRFPNKAMADSFQNALALLAEQPRPAIDLDKIERDYEASREQAIQDEAADKPSKLELETTEAERINWQTLAQADARSNAGIILILLRDLDKALAAIASAKRETLEVGAGIYVASRASLPERSAMWRRFRGEGICITSSWIDEAGEGETADFGELWDRIHREITGSDRLVLYAEPGDFPLKGALIEVGMALGLRKPVTVCLPGVELQGRTHRPIGSWIAARLVDRNDDIAAALRSRAKQEG